MNNAIIVLTGAPDGKNKFNQVAKATDNWVWNANLNTEDCRMRMVEELLWSGEFKEDPFGVLETAINLFQFQGGLGDKTGILLVWHDVSRGQVKELIEYHGAFRIHVAPSRKLNVNIENYDVVLYEDDECFASEVRGIIEALTLSIN